MQQLIHMSQNSKSCNRQGEPLEMATAGLACAGQSSDSIDGLMQHLHQASHLVPVDFLIALRDEAPGSQHQQALAHCLAHAEALMRGRSGPQTRDQLEASSLPAEQIVELTPQQSFSGNRPSNSLLFERLTPETLGALMALYEHKAYAQSVLWNVSAFDQPTEDFIDRLSRQILQSLQQPSTSSRPFSGNSLLQYCVSALQDGANT
ncbi:MAG: hypothetical protein KZQ58_01365 [gamma proteobacterium symbiont of Bathyaustriella thionipta]|nr:hypothetical protein [gamma proteobacterium symbiont of Bathyaustriella thionipta]